MDRKYAKKGMVLVGAEVQRSDDDKIKEVIDEHGLKFTVTKGIAGPSLSNAIPHMAVFDVKGDLVFKGHPNQAEKAIKTALKDVKEDSSTTEEPSPSSSSPPSASRPPKPSIIAFICFDIPTSKTNLPEPSSLIQTSCFISIQPVSVNNIAARVANKVLDIIDFIFMGNYNPTTHL